MTPDCPTAYQTMRVMTASITGRTTAVRFMIFLRYLSASERQVLAICEARSLTVVEKFLRKSIHGGGDQERSPKSREITFITELMTREIRFMICLLK
jgi:hypothetical protein